MTCRAAAALDREDPDLAQLRVLLDDGMNAMTLARTMTDMGMPVSPHEIDEHRARACLCP